MTAGSLNRVQDTARWAAASRALESERDDALFHDRFARRFVGEDMNAMRELSRRVGGTWAVVARTVLIDRLLIEAANDGADAVLNLAAGFDTRPYRLVFPRSLTWIDVDHADVIAARARELGEQNASCVVEQRALDLAEADSRRSLFADVGARFRRLIVLTEGLLYYLSDDAALGLARELRALHPQRWIFDLHNRAVIEMIRKRTGGALRGTAEMRFGPEQGALIFEQCGWTIRSARSSAQAAGKLGRLPFFMSLLSRLPAPTYGKPGWPWAGVCAAEVAPGDAG
ncbi:MAG TPA: class I SAM-dependent methyltransferase [Polyangiaceae bacterium]|nr:class I SAM-dependent methyltransferase [Polyangiaceae bacterium]